MLCVSLAFTGCSDGKVDLVQQKISEIGVVTLESEGQIEEVRALYDQLTDKQKNKVENVDVLEEAQKQYAELKEEEEKRIAEEERIKKAEEMVNQGVELIYSDSEKAQELFEETADINNDAKFLLGFMLDWVGNDEYDKFVRAKKCYEEVCDNNAYAALCLSYLYKNGQGTVVDIDKADEFYNKADEIAQEGYAENTNYPSISFYLTGVYFRELANNEANEDTKNEYYKKSEKYLNKASDLGNPDAMNQVGNCYSHGLGVEQDYAKAMEWFIKAAELGQPNAHNQIGWMYREGLGVEQDYAKAMEWFEKAADLGNNSGMNNIGVMYDWGYGVEKDHAKACEWYKKSAELGNVYAMYGLATKYYNGDGVKKDLDKAKEWCEKAAELGHEEAKEALATVFR